MPTRCTTYVSLVCIGAKEPNRGLLLRLPLSSTFEIGRVDSCDHTVHDQMISATHCRISLEASPSDEGRIDCWLEDTSTNGTYLGDVRLESRKRVRLDIS